MSVISFGIVETAFSGPATAARDGSVASRSAALVSLVAAAPGGRSRTAGGGGAPVTAVERPAAAVVAAQASEEVCGASGRAAAATPVQMPLLLLTRLPRQGLSASRVKRCSLAPCLQQSLSPVVLCHAAPYVDNTARF